MASELGKNDFKTFENPSGVWRKIGLFNFGVPLSNLTICLPRLLIAQTTESI